MTSETPLLQLTELQVAFPTRAGRIQPVHDVSLTLQPGEILGLVGESGCGKSLTAKAVMGLIGRKDSAEVSGSIQFNGEELTKAGSKRMKALRGRDMAMVFQDPMTSLNPAYRIGSQLAEAATLHHSTSPKKGLQRAVEMLERVRLPRPREQAHSFPHEFSGGMRQRAVIGMALMNDPSLIIADEPTTALDVTVQARILDLFRQLRDDTGAGILFITHDLAVVSSLCDRVAVMYAGHLVEEAPTRDLFAHPTHPYTRGLLESVPRLDQPGKRLDPVPGAPPRPIDLPEGCPFQPRCPLADAACRVMPKCTGTADHKAACHHRQVPGSEPRS